MTQKLTVKEAIEQGYKYCTKKWDEMSKVKIQDCKFDHCYLLIGKETVPYEISDTIISELVRQYLDEQEDVYDEYGKMSALASECNYTDITNQVNEKISAVKYLFTTDIQLIP